MTSGLRSWQLPWPVALAMLTSCTATNYQPSSFVLIVEGYEQSYPAFEAAARTCGYTAFWKFPGATVQTAKAGPHYNLSRTNTRAGLCVIRWVQDHPETGLKISAE